MPSHAGHSRCFDCDRPRTNRKLLVVMRSLQHFDRLPRKPLPRNANCISMLVNGLIYRHRWFTMRTGNFSTASQIYYRKCTPGCWYAKYCCALWMLLLHLAASNTPQSVQYLDPQSALKGSLLPWNKRFYSSDLEQNPRNQPSVRRQSES